MGSPRLTAFIGETAPSGLSDEFESLVKSLKKVKEDEEAYVVFLVIDLKKKVIDFKLGEKLTEDSVHKYYYFGNNASAGSQYYLSRDADSLKYLLKSTFSDLYMLLNKNDMDDGDLGYLLRTLENKGFIKLASKKGMGKVNLEKLLVANDGENTIALDENNKKFIYVNKERYSSEAFIRLFIDDKNKKNRYLLVVPKVVLENGEEVLLPTHPEYLDLVKRENKLGESKVASKRNRKVCYICKKRKTDVSSEYSKKLDRTGINKVFTTTTINYSPYFQQRAYDDVYSVCSECYQNLRRGEKQITKKFRSRIAGEDVFLLPEGMLQDFDYEFLNTLKANVDLAFKSPDAEKWIENIKSEKIDSHVEKYVINFIFYRTDGNSVTVLETIEDVPTTKFEEIMQLLAHYSKSFKPHTENISIGSIYRLIPVKVNKKKEQLDIGRVLSFYKAILSGEKVSLKVLFDYATEGLEKGLRQLSKSTVDNYFNLGLNRFTNGNEDFFIRRLVYGYMVLFKTCQDLDVLDKEIFNFSGKVDEPMNGFETPSKEINSSIAGIEQYLERHGFKNGAKALFYLGILVNRVAAAQMQKEHKKKPILRKIHFQGMNQKEVYGFYNDVVEKLRQYDRMTLFAEAIINRFHYYFGTLEKDWFLSDKANVFYIMAGYSFMVGYRSPDYTPEEGEAQKEAVEELNNKVE